MKGTLCVYYSRTGNTKALAEYISKKLNAELLEISDGIDRSGKSGYLKSGYESMKGILPKLNSFGTGKKMEDYRNIIILCPIWAFNICPVTKSFLKKFGNKIKGKVYFIVTHDSFFKYEGRINKLNIYLNNKHESHLSVANKDKNKYNKIDEFIKQLH